MAEPTEEFVIAELFTELKRRKEHKRVDDDSIGARRDALKIALADVDEQRRDLARMWVAKQVNGVPKPNLLLDIGGVLIPYPNAEGQSPPSHVRYLVLPTGHDHNDPVPIWLDPADGHLLNTLLGEGLFRPAWCSSWRHDANRLIAPRLGVPELDVVDPAAPQHHDQPPERVPLETRHRRGVGR